MSEFWLPEQLKTCINLCRIAQILIDGGYERYLPTVLELLYQETQQIIDDNCIKEVK